MTFTVKNLVDDRVLVTGTDILGSHGTTVLDGSQWTEINGRSDFSKAEAEFDAAVEEFFAPLTEAAEKMGKALERPTDSLGYVVLQEEVKATAGQPGILVSLTHDSKVLRLIEAGNTDRLVWVGGDSLEILEADTPISGLDVAVAPEVTEVNADQD